MRKMYVVEEGSMFSGTRYVIGVFTTKKRAFQELRKCGYKYSKKKTRFIITIFGQKLIRWRLIHYVEDI